MPKELPPYRATPDELKAIDEGLAERGPPDHPARIIETIILGSRSADPKALAQRIVAGLDRIGYEVRPKPDLIPIAPNPSIQPRTAGD